MVFKVSPLVCSLFMTILIKWMLPQDGQMLVELTPEFWNLDHFWLSYRIFSKKKPYFASFNAFRMILLFIFTKNAITQPKMVQISKFWCLNPSTNICPSCGNIHSIKMVINNEFTGDETLKTINFRPNFCIKSHKNWNNSFFPP